MLGALSLLLLCQGVGELIVRGAGWPVPGPVVGMVLLFVGLLWYGRIPASLESTGGGLLRYLSLLFVPAGVGLIAHLDRIAANLAAIAAPVLVGTLITILVTGWVVQLLQRGGR